MKPPEIYSLYDALGHIFSGALVVVGIYGVVDGTIPTVTPVGAVGLTAAFFLVGNMVQGIAAGLSKAYWKMAGGWPSSRFVDSDDARSASAEFLGVLNEAFASALGTKAQLTSSSARFSLGRSWLRQAGRHQRSEMLNARYAFFRGLTVAAALVALSGLGETVCNPTSASVTLITASAVVVSAISFLRFRAFGWWFAQQTWTDIVGMLTMPELVPPPD